MLLGRDALQQVNSMKTKTEMSKKLDEMAMIIRRALDSAELYSLQMLMADRDGLKFPEGIEGQQS